MALQEDRLHDLFRKSVAAAGASVLSVLVTTPLDVVKTRMQAQQASGIGRRVVDEVFVERLAIAGSPSICPRLGNPMLPQVCPPDCYVYHSTLDGLRKIVRQEGPNVLWRGVREGMVMAVPLVGIYLPLYDYMSAQLSGMGSYAPVVAGSISRTISLFFVAPLDILRTRTQVASRVFMKGYVKDSGAQISDWRNFEWGQGKGLVERTRILWRGYGALVARDVPFSGIYWGLLEPIRENLLVDCSENGAPLSQVVAANSVAGAMSGTIAAAVTTPLDVVKTRQQIMSKGNSQTPSVHRLLLDIGRNEGLPGLFSGIGPRCIRAAPSCAIVLSTYEFLKRMF